MMIKEVRIDNLPALAPIKHIPRITKDDYEKRIGSLLRLMSERDFTHLVVYGDREHFSNLHFLTGYDPRFEESVLILGKDQEPVLLVGNEGFDYSRITPLKIKRELFQTFSLPGQPRNKSKSLDEILKSAGIMNKGKVGLIGWKYFTPIETGTPSQWIDLPHYLVAAVQSIAVEGQVENATDLMIHPGYGLRVRLDAKELVLQEVASARMAAKVADVIRGLRPGISEAEAAANLLLGGEPLCMHPIVSFGAENVLLGLASPSRDRRLENGDVMTIGAGYWRSLTARTGLYVQGRKGIPASLDGIVQKFYMPYFRALATWYESLSIGASGGNIFAEFKSAFGGDLAKYGVGLNPGHLIHTDEWTNSIFFEGSPHLLSSGMAVQCDIIAFPGPPYVGVHVEDGLIVADTSLRAEIQEIAPDCWGRICVRRRFMRDVLGLNLAEEILPVSDLQAMLFPYLGDIGIVLAKSN